MPVYEYRCQSCQHEFERFSSIREMVRSLECPVCGQTATLKISGGTGLIFKGSGFYITDYKRGNGKSSEEKIKESKDTEKEN